jgi:hypothetical protein
MDRSLTAQVHRLVARERGGGLKVPKSSEHWVAVGVWLASRQLPDVPFFLQLIDDKTGRCCIDLKKPYRSRSLLNKSVLSNGIMGVRVAQRLDGQGRLFGEVRYLCDDITVSYQMSDNAFKWIVFQSVALHASPRRCLCSAAAC